MTTNIRSFRLPAVPDRHCRWCANPITEGRKDRTKHDGRGAEPDCAFEILLHSRREVQYAFVLDRDGPWCWDCREQPLHVRGNQHVMNRRCQTYPWRDWFTKGGPIVGECVGPWCEVEISLSVELEHTVPLWRTTHLPWVERRAYFGPSNLRLRCSDCHGPKTRREAGQRAKEKRQATMRVGAERKEPRRKIPSRGFDQGHRPMQSRPFSKRRKP
jgi:hypothetical protein